MAWYHNIGKEELSRVLTDSSGKTHVFSVGTCKVRPEVRNDQRAIAAAVLPPPMSELFQNIKSPFVQAITDSLATKAVFMGGKVLQVDDGVAGLRPHTTVGTTQVAMHALLLKKLLRREPSMGLEGVGEDSS